jgi:glycogen debranching enzyme
VESRRTQAEHREAPAAGRAGTGIERRLPGLDDLLSPAGWPYASSTPVDRDDPGRFHALFGRDALITSLEVLPARPDVGRATLRMLASLQGRRDDPETDEEPGKIVHEWWPQAPPTVDRAGGSTGTPLARDLVRREAWPSGDGPVRYYGSADATSWFLVVLAALDDPQLAAELEGAWRAAGEWLTRALERGGGLVRHGPREAPGGLVQQGWRDTVDPADPAFNGGGIVRPDGEAPRSPLADADTQAVSVVALRALAWLSSEESWRRRAAALATRVEEAFGTEVVALEADGSPVPGAGSHLGWFLWADVLSEAGRDRAAERLSRPDVLTEWGLRTLSAEHPRFEAEAYHRGSVWPFDSWLGWGGLRAAGRTEAAERLRRGLLAAIDSLGRAPELFAVGADGPEPIPISNRVQAWTVGARWALKHGWDGRATTIFG